MNAKRSFSQYFFMVLAASMLLGGCATRAPYDYTAFKEARPASILVLPPVNNSPDITATHSMMSQATAPLAESGYYVFPVALVDETFKQNGLTTPPDIHQVPGPKLREIFGADAALYINVKQYGTAYMVISSETRVTAEAKLVDLRTGRLLWAGSATASSAEGDGNSGGLIGLLIKAAVRQIMETVSSKGHQIAGQTSARLLSAGRPGGILFGPRSPMYLKEGVPAQ
ncbi:DUF799 domain-containing protein [Quatrionicoccus australiensis]|uniref:DUF799 domain-containing protein n=1 Tax=Quatrionicoccus australiensis TaxID=138118 RepID=UPI001CF93173|nr:DUF799 domain-containing protein [Quatrionicoccus australiensis]MCB4360397.1 DUF799 domain-containing protein [Quatrionicoccus australiensis]